MSPWSLCAMKSMKLCQYFLGLCILLSLFSLRITEGQYLEISVEKVSLVRFAVELLTITTIFHLFLSIINKTEKFYITIIKQHLLMHDILIFISFLIIQEQIRMMKYLSAHLKELQLNELSSEKDQRFKKNPPLDQGY